MLAQNERIGIEMKRKSSNIILSIIMVLSMMALSGCGSKAASIVGTWEADDIGRITFASDGKWITEGGYKQEVQYGEYEISGNTLKLSMNSGENIECKVDISEAMMTWKEYGEDGVQETETIIFRKIE